MKRRLLALTFALLLLLVAAAVVLTGCNSSPVGGETPGGENSGGETTNTTYGGAEIVAERTLGDGAITFTFTVVNPENKATVYTISTDAENLRGALTENNLIPAGNTGDMVVTVDGITADWNVDQGWWKLVANGSMDMVNYGVDDAAITAGANYAFIYTKGF